MIIKNINIQFNLPWIGKLTANEMKRKNKGNIVFKFYLWFGWTNLTYKNTRLKENMSAIIKGGINTLTKSMASYYGRNGIRVNAICAGGVYDNQPGLFIKIIKILFH